MKLNKNFFLERGALGALIYKVRSGMRYMKYFAKNAPNAPNAPKCDYFINSFNILLSLY